MIYILGGTGGTLLSCIINDKPSVEGSNPVMAFAGVLLAYLILKWDQWDSPGSGRNQMLAIILFGIFMNLFLAYQYVRIDLEGQVGALFIGIFFCFGAVSN
jgi:hypothetical protein